MKLSAYLSPSRHGVYYFRWLWPVTADQTRRTVRLALAEKRAAERLVAGPGDLVKYSMAMQSVNIY